MLIDLEGRVNNYDLAYSKALFPVFEAIINSIHAVQEARDSRLLTPKAGRITVQIERQQGTPRLKSDSGETLGLSPVEHVTIEDDGIGFTDLHFKSFDTSDTTEKKRLGGRGIGRFAWLKAFGRAEIRSVFIDPAGARMRTFTFSLPEGVQSAAVAPAPKEEPRRTSVRLFSIRPMYAAQIPRRPDVMARRIVEHCLDYFVVGEVPEIVVTDPETSPILLNDLYSSDVAGRAQTESFQISGQSLQARHLLVTARAGMGHRLHFCANRRVVRSESLDRHLVDLADAVIESDTKRCMYAGYISGDYLDHNVTPERTDFKIARPLDLLAPDDIKWSDIVDGCVQRVQTYLKPYTDPIRDAKRERIIQYVNHQAPRFRPLLKHRPAVFDAIPPNLPNERLDVELYKHQRVYEDELRDQGDRVMSAIDTLDPAAVDEYAKLMEAFLQEWNEVGVTRLAEYVAHRRSTLKILDKTLAVGGDGQYALESAVHRVIFPMRTTSDDVPPDQMNLWIVDEKLAYHSYLASDQPLRDIEVLSVDEKRRPDLIVFDRPVAFADKPGGHDAITIIEFKRPLRKDYDAKHNPIQQIYDYVDRIKGGGALDRSGRPIPVPDTVRFYAYIICDLTPKLRAFAKGASLTQMPDGQGFFGFNPEYRTYIEIISFNKLVADANARNRILFDKLENRQ